MPPRHLLIVYAVTLIWGFNFIAVATVVEHLRPMSFTVLRFAVVLVLLAPWIRPPARGQWLRLIALCLLGGALHFGFFFLALRLSADISSVAILLQTYVPMAALMGVVLLGERMGWRSGAGVAVAFSGVVLVGFDPLVLSQLGAAAAALGAAFCMALATALMRELRGVSALAYQGWMAVVSIAVLVPAALVFEPGEWQRLDGLSLLAWGGVLFSAVASSIGGHGLLFWLVQRHPVSSVTPHLLMAPIFAVLFGILIWGDRLGWRLIVGGGLVLSGVLVVSLRARRRQSAAAPSPSTDP